MAKNIYFLHGEEKFLIKNKSEELLKNAVLDRSNNFNYQVFNGRELDVDTFFEFCVSVPFLSEKKCAKIIDFDISELNEVDLKKFKEALKEIPESTIVLISQVSIDTSAKENTKWIGFLKFIKSVAEVLEFNFLPKRELSEILVSWGKDYGISLKESLAYRIIDLCGQSLLNLKNETDKLFAMASESCEVTENDIDLILVKDLYANVFSISRHIFNRNIDLALKELEILFEKKEEPIMILAVLGSSYIDMYRYYLLKDYNLLKNTFSEYKSRAFRLDIAIKNCKKFSKDSISKSIDLIIQADLKLKSYKVDKKAVLEVLVVNLVRELKNA